MQYIFKPYEQVLTRNSDTEEWTAAFFSHRSAGLNICIGDVMANQCIPFRGNEHLLGTTHEPEPEYDYQWGDKVEVYLEGKEVWEKAIYVSRDSLGGVFHTVLLGGVMYTTSYSRLKLLKE